MNISIFGRLRHARSALVLASGALFALNVGASLAAGYGLGKPTGLPELVLIRFAPILAALLSGFSIIFALLQIYTRRQTRILKSQIAAAKLSGSRLVDPAVSILAPASIDAEAILYWSIPALNLLALGVEILSNRFWNDRTGFLPAGRVYLIAAAVGSALVICVMIALGMIRIAARIRRGKEGSEIPSNYSKPAEALENRLVWREAFRNLSYIFGTLPLMQLCTVLFVLHASETKAAVSQLKTASVVSGLSMISVAMLFIIHRQLGAAGKDPGAPTRARLVGHAGHFVSFAASLLGMLSFASHPSVGNWLTGAAASAAGIAFFVLFSCEIRYGLSKRRGLAPVYPTMPDVRDT